MRLSFIKYLATLFLSTLPVLGIPQGAGTTEPGPSVCNGHAELCSKPFPSVTYVGAHDSYAIGDPSRNLAFNQDQNITTQLNDGIRMLQMQAHSQGGTIRLCHTNCALLDGGTLHDYLVQVSDWLDANPNDVLSLLIVNIENLPVSQYDEVFKQVGLDAISFVPQTTPLPFASWPTLGSMISSQKRLVTFMDNGADPAVPYIIDEFTHVWETKFNVLSTTGFDCVVNRSSPNVDTTSQMFLINHFLDQTVGNTGIPAPFISGLPTTNAASGDNSLGAQVDQCRQTQQGRVPTFMLVDFYEFGGGSVFDVAASINGVPTPTNPVASPIRSSSATAFTGTSSSRPLTGAARAHRAVSHEAIFSTIFTIGVMLMGPRLLL